MAIMRSRSPLKSRPLRSPGDSLRELQLDLVFGRLIPWMWITATCWALAIQESLASLLKWSRHPGIYLLVCISFSIACAVQFWASWRRLANLRLGRDGERAVGEYLDRLRGSAKIFHDIPCDGFNLDHVVVDTTGVYVIETKTRRKAVDGKDRVELTDNSLSINGFADDGPIRQAHAGALWLTRLLEESTGKRFSVRAVIVFPGWWVEPMSQRWKASNPWVLEPKALPAFMRAEPARLSSADVTLIAFHLSRYIRAEQHRLVE